MDKPDLQQCTPTEVIKSKGVADMFDKIHIYCETLESNFKISWKH